MMFLGSKEYTKDLDLVVTCQNDYNSVIEALSELNYSSDKPTCGMDRVDLSDTQIKDRYRIDLFNTKICGQLQLSDSMKQRAQKRFESEKITLYSCAAEDIFLLKSVTEREGDTADCNRL